MSKGCLFPPKGGAGTRVIRRLRVGRGLTRRKAYKSKTRRVEVKKRELEETRRTRACKRYIARVETGVEQVVWLAGRQQRRGEAGV